MTDSLRARVKKYDLTRNSEGQYARTEREHTTKNICVSCRKSSLSIELGNEGDIVSFPLSLDVPCPSCGGKVVSLTW